MIYADKTSDAHISVEVDSNMAVDAGEFRRALESVCDIFKIPSLYIEQEKCLEALFKGKDVYASLPTGYGKSLIFYAAPIVADELFS